MKKVLISLLIGVSLFSVSCSKAPAEKTIENCNLPCKHYLHVIQRLKVDQDTFETYYENDYIDLDLNSNCPIDSDEKVFKDSEGRYYYFLENCPVHSVSEY